MTSNIMQAHNHRLTCCHTWG